MQFNFIKLVNSVQTLHQPTRAQSEKILGRLEIILRIELDAKQWRSVGSLGVARLLS